MSVRKHVTNALRVDRAPGYFTGSGSRNWEPALLWLVVAVIGLNWLRTGHAPNGPQAVTWVGLAGGVVVAGAFVPEIVAVILVGLLIAGALNLNHALTAAVDKATGAVGQLTVAGPTQ